MKRACLAIEELDRLDAAQRLEKVGRALGVEDDGFLGRLAQGAEEGATQEAVGHDAGKCDRREAAAVDQHHGERDHHEQAVEHGLDEAGRHGLLDVLDGAEARHDVARIAPVEPCDWQTHQVGEDVRQPLNVQGR